MSFRSWNKIPSDVHSGLFRAITSKEEEMNGSRSAWTAAICHSILKSHKIIFLVWISFKKWQFESWDFFIKK